MAPPSYPVSGVRRREFYAYDHVKVITDASDAYFEEIGADMVLDMDTLVDTFIEQLQVIDSPDEICQFLDDEAKGFKEYQEGSSNLTDGLHAIVYVSHAFNRVLGEAVSLASLQPAMLICFAVYILLTSASTVPSGYDALVDLFEALRQFLSRIRIDTDIPPTPSRSQLEIISKIIAELLAVFGLATKQIKQGKFKKFVEKLLAESDIEAVLQRLDRLTPEESQMTATQTLEVILGLVENVKIIMNDGTASIDGILPALETMQEITSDINKTRRDRLLEDSRPWLCPPDPLTNYNTACDHLEGTATWFFQGSVFTEWNAMGSLLWIYGKPGSGKTVLITSIIEMIASRCGAGLVSMAIYYFDLKESEKRHLRGLLSSLVFQLSFQSDPCYHILSRLYSDHPRGTRKPSEDALSQCLVEMLKAPGQPAIYIIIDALDECSNLSGMPTAREEVLGFLEDLVKLNLPNVHICVSSRAETDIRATFEPLAPFRMSLHDEGGQKADISSIINEVVRDDWRMRRWREEDKQLVIDTLIGNTDGMLRWGFDQLKVLLRTFPANIRSTLSDMPKMLDDTYERVLMTIDEGMRQHAQRLFQCLAVSIRPLRVEELADILAIRFEVGALPMFDPGLRPGDAEGAVLSACSMLVSVVDVDGSMVVQFSDLSVKEFLTSDRLATSSENLSRFHIVPHSAHTTLAQACLGVLLELDDQIDKHSIQNFPLSGYAAEHWVEHARFGNVSWSIRAAMERLFDPDRPQFAAWVWIYDIDDPWRGEMPTTRPERPHATPLYYAILCGLSALIERLIDAYPLHVNARGGCYGSSLLAALNKEDIDTASLLIRRGADITVRGRNGESLLDLMSGGDSVQVVSFLVEHGANVNSRDDHGWTPLHTASRSGNFYIVRLLIHNGAAVDARNVDNQTPLALASEKGGVEISCLLIESGADLNASDNKGRTSLCLASRFGHLEVVRLLLHYGADANSQGVDLWPPLHLATANGHLKITGLLIQYGADVDRRNESQETALNLASRNGDIEIARLLLKCGSKVNSRDNRGWAPLHSALQAGNFDVARLLLEWGADIDLLTCASETPLDLASGDGKHEVTNFLGERKGRADAWKSRDLTHSSLTHRPGEDGSNADEETTPMHVAARRGHLPFLRSLLKQGADVDERNTNHQTSLDVASSVGRLDVVKLLIDSGADVNSRCDAGWTPLHKASQYGHLDVVRLLLEHGAKVNVREQERWTPLHLASYNGYLEVVHLLLQRGADVHARNFGGWTPLSAASTNGHFLIMKLLSEYGAHENIDVADGPREPTPPSLTHYTLLLPLLAFLLAYILGF